MDFLKRWETIVGIIVGLTVIGGVIWKSGTVVDARYSKLEECKRTKAVLVEAQKKTEREVKLTQIRLDQKILYDRIEQYDERIKRKEDASDCHSVPECETKMDETKRDEYRKLRKDRDLVVEEYDKITVD